MNIDFMTAGADELLAFVEEPNQNMISSVMGDFGAFISAGEAPAGLSQVNDEAGTVIDTVTNCLAHSDHLDLGELIGKIRVEVSNPMEMITKREELSRLGLFDQVKFDFEKVAPLLTVIALHQIPTDRTDPSVETLALFSAINRLYYFLKNAPSSPIVEMMKH